MQNSPSLEIALGAINNALRQHIHHYLSQASIHLSGPQSQLLVLISDRPGSCARQLGTVAGRDKATVTRHLAALVAQGWVTRHTDPNDGRRQILALSADGKQLLAKVKKARADAYRQVFSPLESNDKAALVALLEKCRNR
ncbi:MarR family winged helix-turn-helix transcriptional regulator [Gallaecimonas mangrovi]|uniref:MarR family winged helix-turn-helix transcriptional regulator n=1 Tax=Gallaecimonas mangrovi TaxID=2291597 RepID=UPI000E20466F|nr:MarR family winged helix-turn-helix transcriptional regulator [Gallaecimonas mangrovi]